jgi:membrane protein
MSLRQDIKQLSYWRDFFFKATPNFLLFLKERTKKEQLEVVSGYLSYVSLMSLVPLLVVILSIMTAFPIFSDIQSGLESFIYTHFMPSASEIVQQQLIGFVDNASKMSAVAIFFLFIVAFLLISSIDKTFNRIWRVTEKRRKITSLAMYWMVLTLGPIFVGCSIAFTSYLASLVSVDLVDKSEMGSLILNMMPVFASFFAFVLLYMVVPNKEVPFKYAAIGAFITAILFEIAKEGFARYLTAFPSYEAIYGALAVVPILFLWIYLSWFIVLIGALIVVSLQEYTYMSHEKRVEETEHEYESEYDNSVSTESEENT